MGVAYSVGEVDHLYTFFVQWSPEMYNNNDQNKKRRQPRYLIKEKNQSRYVVVEESKVTGIGKIFPKPMNPAVQNWRIITVKDAKRRLSLSSLEESESDLEFREEVEEVAPVLCDLSQLLEDHHVQNLASHMPVRTQGYPWQMVYSFNTHGSSLKTLYRSMADLDSPVLLVIKDMNNKVFGAFSSHPFKVSTSCYGTGETFLFRCDPEFQVYRWSGENSYFVSGNLESLQFGGGGGGFGLWLDANLYRGSSISCPTFHNPPLSSEMDFIVQDLEVWSLQK